MRLTDNRYSGEQIQFQLAMRMIGHEARTHTIKQCTGLSDDRIRKIYSTYFRTPEASGVRRRRGKSPRQVQRFVKTAEHIRQATSLVSLYCSGRLIRLDLNNHVHACWPRPDVEVGHRLCRAYETYLLLQDDALYSFEWAFSLYVNICYNDELVLGVCTGCGIRFVQDAYSLGGHDCPGCDPGSAAH